MSIDRKSESEFLVGPHNAAAMTHGPLGGFASNRDGSSDEGKSPWVPEIHSPKDVNIPSNTGKPQFCSGDRTCSLAYCCIMETRKLLI